MNEYGYNILLKEYNNILIVHNLKLPDQLKA